MERVNGIESPHLPKNQLLVVLRAAEDFGAGALGAVGGVARAVCNGAWEV